MLLNFCSCSPTSEHIFHLNGTTVIVSKQCLYTTTFSWRVGRLKFSVKSEVISEMIMHGTLS